MTCVCKIHHLQKGISILLLNTQQQQQQQQQEYIPLEHSKGKALSRKSEGGEGGVTDAPLKKCESTNPS